MSTSIHGPASGRTWFNLARHDDGDGEQPTDGAGDIGDGTAEEDAEAAELLAAAAADDDGDEGDDSDGDAEGLGDAGKRALDSMKAERAAAKKEAAAAKKAAAEERRKAADLARRVEEFEDRDRSELEKANAKAERAQNQSAKAVARAVAAEVRASATGRFADISDATDALMRDPARYVDADGEIDTDAIEADLADLLERKPHWSAIQTQGAAGGNGDGGDGAERQPTPHRPRPKPDPGQGTRGPVPPIDYRKASPEELREHLATQYGYRQRA